MKAALSFAVLLTMTFAMFALPRGDEERASLLALTIGFVLLGAWLTGRGFARINLPKVSGYLAFGILVGPSLWSQLQLTGLPQSIERAMPLVGTGQLGNLGFVRMLAIALIAITAGAEIELKAVFAQFRRIGILTVAAVVGVAILIFAGLFGVHATGLPIIRDAEGSSLFVALALLSLIAAGNSPAMAIALISELHADGPLSRMTMMLTVCKDLLLIVLFATLVAVGKGVVLKQPLTGDFLISIAAQLFGSLGVGALAGLFMVFMVQRIRAHLVFFIIFACFGFALLGEQDIVVPGTNAHFHFKPLLVALAAGMTMRNLAPTLSGPLIHTIEEMSLPVYALFFAVAGAELNLSVFSTLATAGAVIAVVLVRAGAIAMVVTWTGRVVGLDSAWRKKLWLCLLPQSGVTLALTQLMFEAYENQAWATGLLDLLLGIVAIHAVAGPVLYRWALVSSGEVGKAGAESQH